MSQEPITYEARHIQVLEGLEAVRKRPGMYIGSTDERGLHNLVFEAADRAVNEVLAGRASRVDVTLMPGGGMRVADDGPGVPFEGTGKMGPPGLDALLTRLMMGHQSLGGPRFLDIGFCGLAVVNALSSRTVAEVKRDGICRVQEYARGIVTAPAVEAGSAAATGTLITFWPDPAIFKTTVFSFEKLAERLRELAFLNRDLEISLTDDRRPFESRSVRFRSPGGARDMLALLDEHEAAYVDPEIIGFEREDPETAGTIEVAMRWRDSGQEQVHSFANSRPTPGGGTHVMGFRDGLEAAVNAYARERRLLTASDPDLGIDQIGKGLTAIVSVKLEYPRLEGSTRGVLGDAAVRARVREAVLEHLGSWLEEHPQQAAAVIERIIQNARQD